jgi:hypothetical protein
LASLSVAACGERDSCPHPADLVLDLEAATEATAWHLRTPGQEASILEGNLMSLAPRQGGSGAVAAGVLFDGSATPQLFSLTLDVGPCVVDAWRRPLEPAEATLQAMLALPDGGLALGGWLPGPHDGDDRDAWVARFDSDGALLWQVTEGEFLYVSDELKTPSREMVQALTYTSDLGLFAAGAADINQALHSNWVLKIDRDGRLLSRIDLPRDDPRVPGEMMTLAAGSEGSLWLAGMLAPMTPEADAWILRLDEHEALLWDRRYGEFGRQWVGAAVPFATEGERGLAIVGSQEAGNSSDGWIAAIDEEGVPLWSSVLKRQAEGGEVFHAAAWAGGSIVAGGHSVKEGEGIRAWLAAFDTAGRQFSIATPTALAINALMAWGRHSLLAGGSDLAGRPFLFLVPAEP